MWPVRNDAVRHRFRTQGYPSARFATAGCGRSERVQCGTGRAGPREKTMAERRDYLLRMIEQMGAVFARLRQLVMNGSGAQGEIQQAAQRAGVDLAMAQALEPDSLIELLSSGGVADPTRTWLMAEFLYLEGLASETEGSGDDALETYAKALRLYAAIDPRVIGGIPEAKHRLAELEGRIDRLRDGAGPV